jgi:hypothetical protein
MSDLKHTKGEWIIDDSWVVTESKEFAVAKVFQKNPLMDKSEAEANLKLVCAAPELLDALMGIMDSALFRNHYIQGGRASGKTHLIEQVKKAGLAIKKAING